jgi:hypothetical protein
MLSHVPTWVFAVLALLLAMGILFSRPRVVHPVAPSLMAVGFACYSLYGVISSFGASAANMLPWALGMAASAFLGKPYVGPDEVNRVPGSRKVLVPGSWLPLALMMGIFAVKFFVGVVNGARMPVGTQAWFAPAVSVALGLLSGGFTARALNVRRYAQAAANESRPFSAAREKSA